MFGGFRAGLIMTHAHARAGPAMQMLLRIMALYFVSGTCRRGPC